ncbi:MAG: hypothetical protein WC992_00075 [Acholeplasmataceae bacterium]|jgi:hypothetical protein
MVTEYETAATDEPLEETVSPGTLSVRFGVSENIDNIPEMAYRLTAEVTDYANIDPHIFVYESVPPVAGRPERQLRFVTVATALHLSTLPIDEVQADLGNFCRRASVDLYFPTAVRLAAARAAIVRRVRLLLENLESLAQTRDDATVVWNFTSQQQSSEGGGMM